MRRVIRAGAAAMTLGALLAAPALAANGLLITEKTTTDGTADQSKIAVEPTRLRMEEVGGQKQVIVFDGDAQVLRIINNANKTYTELTKADVDRMASQMAGMMSQMQDQLKNMPPEQRARIEQMMRGRGAAAMMAQAPKTEYRKSGSGHVGSWDCTKYDIVEDGSKTGELCTASPTALGFTEADFQVTQKMAEFAKSMTPPGTDANSLFSFRGDSSLGFSGIPISRTTIGPPPVTSELVSVERQSFPDSMFQVPDGYRKQALPIMPGGRGGR
jgi:Domain of unknown function (DUF4412)